MSKQKICVNLWNLWDKKHKSPAKKICEIPDRIGQKICVICEICVPIFPKDRTGLKICVNL